ncbi:MAG: CRISPR-associated helicase Cas3' [Sulfobacillus sp.]
MVNYYAHTATAADGANDSNQERWQLLQTHLRNVANLAKTFAEPFGFAAEAEIAGLLHDLGKYSDRFQARLRNRSIHGINHWAAGATHAAALKAMAVAFGVDGHHTGIPALNKNEKCLSLRNTVLKFSDQNLRLELTGQCLESLTELLTRFGNDGLKLPTFSPRQITDTETFSESIRARMLFSCLVDADFLDTEEHFGRKQSDQRPVMPGLHPERALEILKDHLADKSADGPVNVLRRQLLKDCLKAAEKPSGLFTLTAPTGSGKTLSSLAFALQHIVYHNANFDRDDPQCFRRIIVVIPYTSIIEQTARVYREDLFELEFGEDYVLEHHSAVAPRERNQDRERDAEEDRLRRARLAAENWASPLIVTTNVQFFESLFSNHPSDCRKLHNITRSVVLFDEVQTLPPRLVPSLLSAVRLLTRDYGVTAVFMTATQPAFASVGAALPYGWNPEPISTNESGLAEALRRTRIELPRQGEQFTWADIAAKLAAEPQSLCVVNTTKDARELFQLVRNLQPEVAYHLSARMCPAHRQEKLAEIRRRLKPENNEPCRLVSTQLIEAGVDVDFPIAYRALGPLDSIIQTAGRCNREGLSDEPRPVIVFRPKDGGHLPKAYEQVMAITDSFLARKAEAQSRIHQPSFYAEYFAELYKLVGRDSADDDPVFAASKEFNFPTAAEKCRLVGDETRGVLVKWKRGAELAKKLEQQKYLTAAECREAQRFFVNLYQGEFSEARDRNYIYQPAQDWDFWVWNSDYDEHLGIGHLDARSFCQ